MKKNYNSVFKKVLLFSFLLLSLTGYSQHFTATLANLVTTTNTLEVDVVLLIDAPTVGVRLSSFATGIYFNPAILNGGTPCTTTNCGSWEYIPGTRSTELLPLNTTVNTNRANPVGHLRIVQTPAPSAVSVDILPGTYILGRYRFTNTVSWAVADAQLYLSDSNAAGSTNTIVTFFSYGTTTPLSAYTVTYPANGSGLTLGYTQSSPLSRILNSTLTTTENNVSSLQVYPNPFSTSFNLDFETISNEQINLKVYDMIGKLIENRIVEAATINTITIGENYQSGIYNVAVSQGEKIQNIRVIKK
jgi:hypothetical protein